MVLQLKKLLEEQTEKKLKRPTIKIAVVNWKGGTGKTTTVFQLSAMLAKNGYRILCIDANAQGDLTKFYERCGASNSEGIVPDLSDIFLKDNINVESLILHTNFENIDIIPTVYPMMAKSDMLIMLAGEDENGFIIRDNFQQLVNKNIYDFMFFDCSNVLNPTTMNILNFVDYSLVPMRPDESSVEAYENFMKQSVTIQEKYNKNLKCLGGFFVAIENTSIDKFYREEIKNLGEAFIDISIRKSVEGRYSNEMKRPLAYNNSRTSKLKQDYENLTQEILKRMGVL